MTLNTTEDTRRLCVDDLPTAAIIQERVNKKIDSLYFKDVNGDRQPYVCSICDKLLVTEEDNCQITVAKMKGMSTHLSWTNIPDPTRPTKLQDYYSMNFESIKFNTDDDLSFLNNMALSPRGILYKKATKRHGKPSKGFSCCKRCKTCAARKGGSLPRHAIVNRNYIGAAPKCLLDLTETELAFISPVQNYGYCFTWQGGRQLKGTLTFMRVQKRSIGMAAMKLEALGFNQHVLVLFTGKMTKKQKKRAKEYSTIRTDKVITALEWLCDNNPRWSTVNLDEMRRSLKERTPVIYDRSEELQNQDSNVEEKELFTCYYPDGATNPNNGGFEEPGQFKEYVQQMAEKGYDVEFQANLEQKFINDSETDLLIDACLLQFPYGVGGIAERRKLQDGSWTTKSDLCEYIQELSLNSQPQFHSTLFQLILYSLLSKQRLLKSSRLQLRGKTDAENLAQGLNAKDVISCINGRRLKNRHAGTNASKKFLNAVDATAKALPHTNEASKAARGIGEAMQHHFGMSSLFLTATFDDENSLLIQVMSGQQENDSILVDRMTDSELSGRAENRRQLRLKLPGLAALNFEMLYRILLEEVIGWDIENNTWNGKEGFLGEPFALSAAMEEQGRKTIHTHMTVWIRGYKTLQNDYFFGTKKEKDTAMLDLGRYSEHVQSTELFPTKKEAVIRAFDHDCTVVNKRSRRVPVVIPDQHLRDLRHRYGHKDSSGKFATCPECYHDWTYEDMIASYLRQEEGLYCPKANSGQVPVFDVRLSSSQRIGSQVPKARCYGKMMEYQKDIILCPPKSAINAACQSHLSCHVSNCFKCQKAGNKKRGHVCGPTCECRYRLPDKKRARATVMEQKETIRWFSWNGDVTKQPLAQILPKRGRYDLFQNVCCNAISHSKFTCNSNVSLILDGPIGQYMHKYQQKENQEEESADYKEVEAVVKKFDGDRKHEQDRPEALRRICRAAFAHNKKNVISGAFASYLLRHDSRFYYSHEFKFCPLKDVVRLHHNQDVRAQLKYAAGGNCFFENMALDYLCRGKELEETSLREFTESFYMKYAPNKPDDENPVIPCEADTGYYIHPSVIKSGKRKGKCSQGAALREKPVLIRVSQWMFPDTASFKANFLTCEPFEFVRKMEEYALLVLSLFMPHRSCHDLKAVGATSYPHLHKIREVYLRDQMRKARGETPVVFTVQNVTFLQNLQNCRSNTLRFKITDDELTRGTVAYSSPNPQDGDEEGQEAEEEIEETAYEQFAEMLEQEFNAPPGTDLDPAFLNASLRNFKFDHMKDKGKMDCGYTDDIEAASLQVPDQNFVDVTPVNANATSTNTSNQDYPVKRPKYTARDIVKLHLKRTVPKTNRKVWDGKEIEVNDPSGSVKSIREWSKAAFGSDRKQQRAFEVLTSAFLLTFYEETAEDATDATRDADNISNDYEKARKALLRLRGCKDDHSLICLLHGPGGSGKSTVIDMVKAYAAGYCKQLGHPFTNRTIIITAMSGVAATLLNGETTHSVLGLNRDSIQSEEIEDWVDARLLVIDECSFKSDGDYKKAHENLKQCMQEHYKMYGGLNIVFAGDFSQLEPVKKDPIYKDDNYCPEFHGALNCFIELNGKWRFLKDPVYGEMMSRMRQGEPTVEDIEAINEECHVSNKAPPTNIQIASYTNKDRDAINAALFDDWTKCNKPSDGTILAEACMIFMDELYMKDSSKTKVPVTSNSVKRHFYENCTESECNHGKSKQGRMDPVLKMYPNAPMMLTQNSDVANGEANGSRVYAKKVKVKAGEQPFPLLLDNGTTIKGIYASQVEHILVQHENKDITPSEFTVEPATFNFSCRMTVGMEELYVGMSGYAFPIISNSCTTGHKLQGCTVDEILVNDWFYGANWAYVVLSRVKTMAGLYLRKKLSTDLKKYAKPDAMKRMLKKFSETLSVEMLSDEEYAELEGTAYVAPVTVTPDFADVENLSY